MTKRRNIMRMAWRSARPLFLATICVTAVLAEGTDTTAQSARLREPTTAFFNGTIADYANGRLVVETDDGHMLHAMVNPRTKIALLSPAEFTDLEEGVFIASSGNDTADAGIKARDVRIVEERLRGVGEGHRPFHGGEDKATTTNAKIISVAEADGVRTVNIRARGRDLKMVIGAKTPIMFQKIGDASALTPGAPVSVFTVRSRTGNTDVVRINIGQKGIVPKF